MYNAGDCNAGSIVRIPFNTNGIAGNSVTYTGGTIAIFKDGSTTERTSANGVTIQKDHDGNVGAHLVSFDLSDNSDAGFYAAGSDYKVKLVGATIDGQTVNGTFGAWSIDKTTVLAKLANVAHGGVATTITFERVIGVSTTSNQSCFSLTGLGSGHGIHLIGGATGNGALFQGLHGIRGVSVVTGGCGLTLLGGAGGAGMLSTGGTATGAFQSGHGVQFIGGPIGSGTAAGHGATFTRGGSSADDIFVTNSDAPTLSAAVLVAGGINSTVAPNLDAPVSGVAASVWAFVVEGAVTAVEILRGIAAFIMGKTLGANTANPRFRDLADSKNRIDMSVDADGNRSAVAKDLT